MRGFVVTLYQPAFAADAGCPPASANDYARMLATPWRSAADIAAATGPSPRSIEPDLLLAPALRTRGFAPGIDTYIHPFAAPDPGLAEPMATPSEGFDLDGKPGIDNGLYRAWGCLAAFRGDQAPLVARANARMQAGLYTMVIRLSGRAAPANDDHVTVEIGYSPDPLVRNNRGEVLADYSYRLARAAQYSRVIGRITGNVLTVGPVSQLRLPDFAWSESNRGEALFQRGQLRLTLSLGGASGLIGGYRDWRALYAREAFNVALEGPALETQYAQDQIGMYYALQRHADALPDEEGRNSAISTAYRLSAVRAFVVDPAVPAAILEPVPSARIAQERALFRQAQQSHRIMPSP